MIGFIDLLQPANYKLLSIRDTNYSIVFTISNMLLFVVA
jgi:hypothetical protein